MTETLPAAALEDCGIVLGRRGAGKSNALMTLFERELDAGHRAVMIDPKGDRWGIRLNPDKSPSRFTIPIFGGDHGDLPVDAAMGERLGITVAEHDLSCLIDLSHLSLADKQRFMLGFAPALLKRNRAALTIFIEEVDQFANQDPRYQPAMLVHHIANFGTLGRQRGIVPWFASQRPAKVNATVRSQADTFVGMKVTMPLDRDAYRDWFKGHSPAAAARVEAEIGSLKPGEALAWVGATEFFEKVTFPMASTYDSGRTPKHGEVIEGVVLPRIKLGEVAAGLAAAEPIPETGSDYADPILNEQLSDLRGQLAMMTGARDRVEVAIKKEIAAATPALVAFGAALRLVHENMERAILAAFDQIPAVSWQQFASPSGETIRSAKDDVREAVSRKQPVPEAASHQSETSLTRGAAKLIDKIAAAQPRPLTLEQAAKLGKVSTTSSQWPANRRSAERSGLIDPAGGGRWRLSPIGILQHPSAGGVSTLDAWRAVLPPYAAKLLTALVAAGGAPMHRDALADAGGISRTSSQLGGGLKVLADNGLAEKVGAEWRATGVVL